MAPNILHIDRDGPSTSVDDPRGESLISVRDMHVAPGTISPKSSVLGTAPGDGAMPARRTTRHHPEFSTSQGPRGRCGDISPSAARKTNALDRAFAGAATLTIQPGKLHTAGPRRRQRDCRRGNRENLAFRLWI